MVSVNHSRRARRAADQGRDQGFALLLRELRSAEGHQPRRSTTAASPPSSARRAAASRRCCASSTASTSSIPASAPTGEVLLDGDDILDARPGPQPAARARSAWCSRSRRRSRCRSTTTSPSASASTRSCRAPRWTSASSRRCASAALWDEVKDKLKQSGLGAFGRPAAAAVHRPRHRGQARGAAARRAVLGARSDLDRARSRS